MQTNEHPRSGHVVIGVDTHKHMHVAAVMDTIGGILGTLTIPTDTAGFQQLADRAGSFGHVLAFGIEGTGSYSSTLTSFLRRAGHKVVEVGRPDRQLRRTNGKSDTLDAENAARAVLAGFATATPKTADGEAEMIRQLKIAHDQAVEQRAAAMVIIKAMLVHARTPCAERPSARHRSVWRGSWRPCVLAAWKDPRTLFGTRCGHSPSGGSTWTPRPKN